MGFDMLRHADGLEEAARQLLLDNPQLPVEACYFCSTPDIETLQQLASEKIRVILETRCKNSTLGPSFLEHCRAGGLGWSLRTETANHSDFSHFLAKQIATHFQLDDGMVETLDLALSEALSNAITHGNLGIAGLSGADISQFAQYCELRTSRLKAENFGGQRLDISAAMGDGGLEVAILDRGEGYEPGRNSNDPPPLIGGGLGLEILKTLASELIVTQGGRCLTLRFHR